MKRQQDKRSRPPIDADTDELQGMRSSPRGRNPWGKNRCRESGKVRFRDHDMAVAALHWAARNRLVAEELGVPCSRSEVRTYWCDGCRGWHLTSWMETPLGSDDGLTEAVDAAWEALSRTLRVSRSDV